MNSHDRSKLQKPEPQRKQGSNGLTGWNPGVESQPEEWAHLDIEIVMNRLLDELPDAPVPSNFTSRVMERIQLERRAAHRSRPARWWDSLAHLVWGRKLAIMASFLAVGFLSYQQYQMFVRRDLAQSIASLASVVQPTLEVLQDLSAIEGFKQVALHSAVEETDLMDAMK
ncbi:MAG: hypothetical protein EXS31_03170 [Pedosphaera sp.]|nr:hypothetical protein [Pedosphaera sp.]